MGLILGVIAGVCWLVAIVVIWSLCRAAARADHMAKEQQRDRREDQ